MSVRGKGKSKILGAGFLFSVVLYVVMGGLRCTTAPPMNQSPPIPSSLDVSDHVLLPSDTAYLTWNLPQNQISPTDRIILVPVDGLGPNQRVGTRTEGTEERTLWSQALRGIPVGSFPVKMPGEWGLYQFKWVTGEKDQSAKAASVPVLIVNCGSSEDTRSKIKHLVLIVQENHSFDNIFGKYCKASPDSNPQCTSGRECCESGPLRDPGTGNPAVLLTDQSNKTWDPNHSQACEARKLNGGKMDRFVSDSSCGSRDNFSYADATTVGPYWDFAKNYAIADHYFQPILGASSSNDMYFATANYMFTDNEFVPRNAVGSRCSVGNPVEYSNPNIGDMLRACNISFKVYAGGYGATKAANGECPRKPSDCPAESRGYPCTYDPSDIPFQYFPKIRDNPASMGDLDSDFISAINSGTLPEVVFIKPVGYKTEHPGSYLSLGVSTVKGIVDRILSSPLYQNNTLILVTYDESGGYFDHIPPPPDSSVDQQPYGPRVPLMAIGHFAKRNFVSHVVMEHSSIVKFIEWNWFGGEPNQLQVRDATVNSIGSLLDPEKTGVEVP